MTEERPIYEDQILKIDHDIENDRYTLAILGVEFTISFKLEDLAITPRGGLERKLFVDHALLRAVQNTIGVSELHIALCQAYIEQEKRRQESLANGSRKHREQDQIVEGVGKRGRTQDYVFKTSEEGNPRLPTREEISEQEYELDRQEGNSPRGAPFNS